MAVPRPVLLLAPLLLAAASPGAHAQTGPTAPDQTTHPAPAHPPDGQHAPVHQAPLHHPPVHHPPPHHPPPHAAHTPLVRPQPHPARQKPAAGHPARPAPSPAPAPAPAAPAAPAPDAAAAPDKGSVTGLPLPRFAALRSDDVNLRAGPGTQYPIDWVYKRRDLPVEIEREFDVWRLISDQDGVRGWVNQATLMARRGFVVAGAERTVRSMPNDQANPVARLQVGVIGRLRACPAGSQWCEVQVGAYRGWLKRDEIWGVLPAEVVQP